MIVFKSIYLPLQALGMITSHLQSALITSALSLTNSDCMVTMKNHRCVKLCDSWNTFLVW